MTWTPFLVERVQLLNHMEQFTERHTANPDPVYQRFVNENIPMAQLASESKISIEDLRRRTQNLIHILTNTFSGFCHCKQCDGYLFTKSEQTGHYVCARCSVIDEQFVVAPCKED